MVAIQNLKLQGQQERLAVAAVLRTASTNLDTMNKAVGNQAAGVRNTRSPIVND